jgi:hypothetical protein
MEMRMPTLNSVLGQAIATARRFPFVILSALVAAGFAQAMVSTEGSGPQLRALLSAQLGISLLTALALFAERLGKWHLPLSLGGVLLLVLHHFSMPDPMGQAAVARVIQFNLAAHLLVLVLPYLGRGEDNGFWQMAKSLFLRLFGSLLFTGVLVIGLNVALLTLDKLFGLSIDDDLYLRIFLLLLFLFNTWYFLGGVPDDPEALERSDDFPRALKVFAQHILSPLVAVYLALLVAYLIKVIVTTQWPSGWIGWLVSSVAAAGLLSLALLHPLVGRRENRWISTYARAYFILMLPAVGMQLMAIGKRIGQYGITENRYFIAVLALWLLVVSVAGALDRLKSLKPLPLSLCIIALLSSFGPWGAYSVSRHDQTGRLEQVLDEAGLRDSQGKITAATGSVDQETRRELSAILDYLMEQHGPESVEALLAPDQNLTLAAMADSLHRRHERPELSRQFMSYLDLEHTPHWRRSRSRDRFHFTRQSDGEAMALDGFRYLQPVDLPRDQRRVLRVAGQNLKVKLEARSLLLEQDGRPTLSLPLDSLLAGLRAYDLDRSDGTAPNHLLQIEGSGEALHVRLLINQIGWRRAAGDQDDVNHLVGNLLIDLGPIRP